MPLKLSEWDDDLPIEEDEEYQAFLRTLRFTEGFALLFVRCSPAGGKRLISQVKEDINDQNIEVITLDKDVTNLYQEIDKLPNKNKLNILFITGLESSLYKYEEAKTLAGWSSRETHHYSWEGVPPILININLERERLRDSFNICFIFLLPQFAIKYFIHRAPDFFDWRSGLFEFPIDQETLKQELLLIRQSQDVNDNKYLDLTNEERNKKILKIQGLLEENHQIDSNKVSLFFELGNLYRVGKEYKKALNAYEKALELNPRDHKVWDGKGITLRKLEQYQEAVKSYDKALEIEPNNFQAWNDRGLALYILGSYTESIISCEEAIAIKPDFAWAWNNRGLSLKNLRKYKEAISSYDKALEIQPDYYIAWDNRGELLNYLGRYEEAVASYDKAVEFKPDDHQAWYNRGNSLHNLGRYEEAVASYDKALEIKPNNHEAWYNRGFSLYNLERYKEAILSYDKALEIKPDFHQGWYNRGFSLYKLGKYEEAILSYDQALEIKPDSHKTWYNKACFYALQGNIEKAIEDLKIAINLNPEEVREWTKTDSDFDAIREDERFQALIQ